jgi:hypothetical protein
MRSADESCACEYFLCFFDQMNSCNHFKKLNWKLQIWIISYRNLLSRNCVVILFQTDMHFQSEFHRIIRNFAHLAFHSIFTLLKKLVNDQRCCYKCQVLLIWVHQNKSRMLSSALFISNTLENPCIFGILRKFHKKHQLLAVDHCTQAFSVTEKVVFWNSYKCLFQMSMNHCKCIVPTKVAHVNIFMLFWPNEFMQSLQKIELKIANLNNFMQKFALLELCCDFISNRYAFSIRISQDYQKFCTSRVSFHLHSFEKISKWSAMLL